MAKIKLQPVPASVVSVMQKAGIKIKKYTSPQSLERDIKKFIRRNQVMHLATYKHNAVRSTPVGYVARGLTFYLLSEGGGKFDNLKKRKQVSFSIAEPYFVEEDFWGYKGLQAWGTAKIISRKGHPKEFQAALKRMNITIGGHKVEAKNLSPAFNHKIIIIEPDKMKYKNPREGVFGATWEKL